MKTLLVVSLFISSVSFGKEFLVKQRKTEVKISASIDESYEAKESFLNTPLLIWNKKLKHHGPSIGVFPVESGTASLISKKGKSTNFKKFKSDNTTNLKSLKASAIRFDEPKYGDDRVVYNLKYKLPGNIEVFSSETIVKCFNKGIQIKSVVKSVDYKKFKSAIEKIIKSIKCIK